MSGVMRSFAEIVSDNPWQRAYALAVLMSAMLVGLSLMVYGYGVESTVVNGIVAASLCFVGFFCGSKMVLAGAILRPLPYFMIGCTVFYGAGTVIAILNPQLMEILSFSKELQRVMLAKINLANALGFFPCDRGGSADVRMDRLSRRTSLACATC